MAIPCPDRERKGKTRFHGIATPGASNQESPREVDRL
jgi:hypothetical protein